MTKQSSPSYLTGKLLLAMPAMGDPRFYHAVIFMISHHALGAMGLVINAPIEDFTFEQLMKEVGLAEIPIKRKDVILLNGGPVETQHGFLLHTSDYKQENTIEVNAGLFVSASLDALQAFAAGQVPKEGLLALGYAGWAAGQLEQELQDNAWSVVDADHEILFNTAMDDRWERAFSRLGIDPSLMSYEAGRA